MVTRKIVNIDEELCNGCGLCVPACHEGAIRIIGGKAKLVGDNLCDGLGDCLGECPQGAITVEVREAEDYDEDAVRAHLAALQKAETAPQPTVARGLPKIESHGGGCPGSRALVFEEQEAEAPVAGGATALRQWPVQLHLISPTAPYYLESDLLIAADCTAFAMGDFHSRFLKGHSLAIACPKLDQGLDIYMDKLVALIDQARINTVTVLVMQVPCCSGLVQLVREAAARARRKVPIKKVVVGLRGAVLSDEWL